MNYRSSDEAIQEIMNVTGITPDEAQMKVLKHIGGMCILSTAGSGKTEILTQLTSKRILTGEIKDVKKVLLTTYSVGGREELEDRINKMLKRLGIKKKLEVRTLHSSYMLMLNQVGYNPKIMAGYERTNLIKQACLDTNVRLDEEALVDLDTILSYQINNMMTDEILYKQNNFNIDITLNQYKLVAAKFRELKIKSGLNDFDDLQMLVLNLLRTNEDARKLFRSLWEYYYIDEFQDVSKIQFEILKMLIQNPDNLVVIGDDDQCIYEWRGADPNIIQNICGYYDIAQFVLNMNYRCGENIVRPASRTIENNSNRVDKTIKAFNSGGKLIVENMGNSMYEISAGIADYVLGLIKQGVKEEDIAVLCRNNIHGVIIHDMISTITIPRAVKDMRFGSNTIANDIDFCVELVKDSVNHRQVSNLWKLVKYLPASQCGLIGKIMYNNGCSLAVAIKSILVDLYDIDIIDSVKEIRLINNKNYTGLRDLKDDSVNGLYNLYITLTNTSLSEEDKAIKVIENYLSVTVGFIYKDPDKKRMVFAIADYIIDLIYQKGIDGYIKHFNLSKRYANLEIPPTRNCISISTMNGSKGKQWKYVVLVADDNLSMPSFRIIKDMIDERTPILEVSNYIEQERRLHYVAMTRAKEELRVFTTQGKQSVYLLEALGILKKDDSDRLNTHVLDVIQNNGYDETLKRQIEEVMKDYKA